MKKVFVIAVACMVHTHGAHGMEMLGDAANAGLNLLNKWAHPDEYVLGSQNAKLYQEVLEAINDKSISELRIARFPDKKNILHQFDMTLKKRVADREYALIPCVVDQSLIQDPCKTDKVKLSDMITVNRLIIPDLYLALALRSLQEQKNEKIPVNNTGSIIVDVYLHKISQLPAEEQTLLKNKLQEGDAVVTVEQKRKLAETWLLSLPEDEQEKFWQKMGKKLVPSTVKFVAQKKNESDRVPSRPNTPTRSVQLNDPNKITTEKKPTAVDTGKQKKLSLGTSAKKITNSDNNPNEQNLNEQDHDDLDEYNIIGENGEEFINNENIDEPAGDSWHQFQ